MGAPVKFDVAKARQLRESGMTFRAIGAALGVSHPAIIFAIKDPKRGDVVPRKRGRPVGSVKAKTALAPSKLIGRPRIEIPAWVVKAGLADEYRELANTNDEFFAASHCRSLMREMRQSA